MKIYPVHNPGNKLDGDVGDSLPIGSNVSLFSAEGEV